MHSAGGREAPDRRRDFAAAGVLLAVNAISRSRAHRMKLGRAPFD